MSKLEIKRDGGKIYCPLTASYHIETPEEKVRQEYIIKGTVNKCQWRKICFSTILLTLGWRQ